MMQFLYIFISLIVGICPRNKNPEVVLEKNMCMGYCPSYRAEIYKDGTIKYEGRANVKNLGNYTFKIDPAYIKQWKNKAKTIGFWNMQDKYEVKGISDFPSTFIEIRDGKKYKKIEAIGEMPDELLQFIKEISTDVENVTGGFMMPNRQQIPYGG